MHHTSHSLLGMSAGRVAFSCLALTLGVTKASVLGPRDFVTTRAEPSRSLGQRDTNFTLTDSLLAVVAAADDSTLQTRDGDPTSYGKSISANAPALNNIFGQSAGAGIAQSFRASLTCQAASLVFGDDVITPKSSLYTTEEDEPWSVNCHMPPACFIKPQSPLGVALALKIITTLQSTFATRGAGHNANPGFSSVGQEGVVLHLGSLDQLTFSGDKSTVSFGAGNQWDQVYGAAGKYNLTVAGGRAAGVGVGGLLLGGGMSHFSNYWGMACDNVVSYEVVLADSRIIQASAFENADLFKALKGGGPNFGIVTQFTSKTFPGSQLWYKVVVYSASDVAAVMEAATQVEAAMLKDNRIGFFLSDSPGSLTAGMIYRGYAPPESSFEAFDNITPLIVAIHPTIGDFQSCAIALASPYGLRLSIVALTVATDASLYTEMHDILASYANNSAISLTYTIQPFSAQGVAHGVANGGNVLNVAPQNQAWLGYATTWTDPSLNDLASDITYQILAETSKAAAAKGELLAYQFMNDGGIEQSPLRSYGSASLSYLTSISKKYDPQQILQKLQKSGYLVTKA